MYVFAYKTTNRHFIAKIVTFLSSLSQNMKKKIHIKFNKLF